MLLVERQNNMSLSQGTFNHKVQILQCHREKEKNPFQQRKLWQNQTRSGRRFVIVIAVIIIIITGREMLEPGGGGTSSDRLVL